MENRLLISVPFAQLREERNSRRYYWRSQERGPEPFVILQWTISGEGFLEWNGREWRIPPDHAVIVTPPEESGYGYPPDGLRPWKFSWVNFYGALAVGLFRDFRQRYGPVLPLAPRSNEGAALAHLMRAAASRKDRDPHELSARAYDFLMEWSRALESPRRATDPVEMALRICEARFHEPLGIKELAAAAGMTREHFTRIFTAQTGDSPARYLRQIRVTAARRMLRTASRTETALRCGFPSVRALNRALNGI